MTNNLELTVFLCGYFSILVKGMYLIWGKNKIIQINQ
uniref:Uncharacterized protein n=1 Tax=viral metagenome TaxID=1070528 RepID=A0A6C0H670_9ZZZZ